MTIGITDNDKGLKTGSLSSSCLLLNRHDFHHLIVQMEKVINYLVLLNWEREKVDLFNALNVTFFD